MSPRERSPIVPAGFLLEIVVIQPAIPQRREIEEHR